MAMYGIFNLYGNVRTMYGILRCTYNVWHCMAMYGIVWQTQNVRTMYGNVWQKLAKNVWQCTYNVWQNAKKRRFLAKTFSTLNLLFLFNT